MIIIPNRTKMLSNNLDEPHASAVAGSVGVTNALVATVALAPSPHKHE